MIYVLCCEKQDEPLIADTDFKRLVNYARQNGWDTSKHYILTFDPDTEDYEGTIIESSRWHFYL